MSSVCRSPERAGKTHDYNLLTDSSMAHFVSNALCEERGSTVWPFVFCECKTFHSFLRLSANCNKAKTQKPPSPHFFFFFVFAQIPLGEATMIYEFEPHSTFPLEQDLQPSVWTVTGFVVLPLYTGFLNQTTWVSFEVQTFSSKPNWQTLSCLKVQEMDRCLCCSSLM